MRSVTARARVRPFLAVFHGPYWEPMAKNPDKPKKDPARPTRAKAAREPLAPIAPALEQLLNPGIAKGTAGVGSQTGLTGGDKPAPRSGRLPGEAAKEAEPKTGL